MAFTVILGILYPLAITGIAQLGFSAQGERLAREARRHRRRLEPDRPDLHGGDSTSTRGPPRQATGTTATSSSASNLGPSNPQLVKDVGARIAAYRHENGLAAGAPVPVEAVTSSGSGLDPHISPADARIQAARVARERNLPLADVLALVEEHTDGRTLGFLGEPGVNVLELNLALDAAK